jgi:hypothetical protein
MIAILLIIMFLFGAGIAQAEIACSPKRDCHGKIQRSPAQVAAFKRTHPCPVNGRTRGSCPGYIVDHIKALCVCGKDKPSNMQWQTIAEAKKKDRTECAVKEFVIPKQDSGSDFVR